MSLCSLFTDRSFNQMRAMSTGRGSPRSAPNRLNGSNRVGIEFLGKAAFDVSNVAGWRRQCLPDMRCLLPKTTVQRGNREWMALRDLDSRYGGARAGDPSCLNKLNHMC